MIEKVLIGFVRAYQVVWSPLLPGRCKYHPSCSQYAIDALRRYGAARGIILAVWRILRCNPFSYGGFDPVEAQRLFRYRAPRSVGLEATRPTHGGGVG